MRKTEKSSNSTRFQFYQHFKHIFFVRKFCAKLFLHLHFKCFRFVLFGRENIGVNALINFFWNWPQLKSFPRVAQKFPDKKYWRSQRVRYNRVWLYFHSHQTCLTSIFLFSHIQHLFLRTHHDLQKIRDVEWGKKILTLSGLWSQEGKLRIFILKAYRVFFLFWHVWHAHILINFWPKIMFLDIFHIYIPFIFCKKNLVKKF